MKRFYRSLLRANVVFIILIFAIGCEEDVNRPVIRIAKVSDISENGVTFNASILAVSDPPPVDYGFVWAPSSAAAPEAGASLTFSFHAKPPLGKFNYTLQDNLGVNENYQVRAFVNVGTSYIYSDLVIFKSLGGSAPVITDFTPKQGSAGTEITVTGNHFNTIAAKEDTVVISGVRAQVISATLQTLVFKIPSVYTAGKTLVSINTNSRKVVSTDYLTLIGPDITTLSPATGEVGSSVTISGSGFGASVDKNVVMFGNMVALVTAASANQLIVEVPALQKAGVVDVSVAVDQITGISPGGYTVVGPEIISVTPVSGVAGTVITITGNNFSSVPSENNLVFGGYTPVIPQTATSHQLTAVLPDLADGPSRITMKVKTISTFFDGFSFNGARIADYSPRAQYGGRTVTITGANFNPGTSETQVSVGNYSAKITSLTATSIDITIPLQVVPPTPLVVKSGYVQVQTQGNFTQLSPWTVKNTFPGAQRAGAAGFVIGPYGYLGTGLVQVGATTDFWSYDPAADNWKSIAPFPGTARAFSFSFSINGKGYVGGGDSYYSTANNVPKAVLKDMWQYDPSNDTWTRMADFPSASKDVNYPPSAMVIGSKAYVLDGYTLYAYDPSTNLWTIQNQGYPGQFSGHNISFSANNKGYTGLGEFNKTLWEYDPSSDEWRQLPAYPGLDGGLYEGVNHLSLGGKLYVGSSNYFDYDFWEYDPMTNAWTALPFFPKGAQFSVGLEINGIGFIATGNFNDNPVCSFNPTY